MDAIGGLMYYRVAPRHGADSMTNTAKVADLKASLDFAVKRVELERERDRLRQQLGLIEDKLRALDLLKDRTFLAYVLSTVSSQGGTTDPASSNGGTAPAPQTGLRSAIRAVLADTGQPMKPIEVTSHLYERGFGGGHDVGWLKLRVSQEMHRMMVKQKQLKRLPSGRYKLVEPEASEGEEQG